jgi:hypothetical protein
MSKITKDQILSMNQRQLKAYSDLHPEESLRISWFMFLLSLELRLLSLKCRFRKRYRSK